jgi:hypothetical protein
MLEQLLKSTDKCPARKQVRRRRVHGKQQQQQQVPASATGLQLPIQRDRGSTPLTAILCRCMFSGDRRTSLYLSARIPAPEQLLQLPAGTTSAKTGRCHLNANPMLCLGWYAMHAWPSAVQPPARERFLAKLQPINDHQAACYKSPGALGTMGHRPLLNV